MPRTSSTPRTSATRPALREIERLQASSVGFLLIRCGQLWNERAIGEVNRDAGRLVLRDAHTRLFPHLTVAGGVRITELARRLGVSKQAVQPLIAELEGLGIVMVDADPDDARARRVQLTPQGIAAFRHGTGVLISIEDEIRRAVGPSCVARLQRDLSRLRSVLEPQAADRGR
jgi:DNA-binding MarR family transcriptional regulator